MKKAIKSILVIGMILCVLFTVVGCGSVETKSAVNLGQNTQVLLELLTALYPLSTAKYVFSYKALVHNWMFFYTYGKNVYAASP